MPKPRSNPSCRRRAGRRLLCADLVRVTWEDSGAAAQEEIAVVEDHSRSGVSLFLGVPLTPDTRVTVHTGRAKIAASIRYCVAVPNGYLAGASFDAAAGYVPKHLLDPERLEFEE